MTSNLHDIEDLEEIYRLVRRTLKPGGRFLFNIEHPTFTAGIKQQFAEDASGRIQTRNASSTVKFVIYDCLHDKKKGLIT